MFCSLLTCCYFVVICYFVCFVVVVCCVVICGVLYVILFLITCFRFVVVNFRSVCVSVNFCLYFLVLLQLSV